MTLTRTTKALVLPAILCLMAACNDADRITAALAETKSAQLRLDVVSGQDQQGAPGQTLPQPLIVRVVNSQGQAVAGQVVNFRVTSGGGTVFAGTGVTDASGLAQEWWTLGPQLGSNALEARAVNSSTGERQVFATFRAEARDPATTVADVSVTPSSVTLTTIGGTAQLQATAYNSSGSSVSATFAWSSTNPAAATVSSTGVITAVGTGTAQVIATSGGQADTSAVTVTIPQSPPPPQGSSEPQPTSTSRISFRDDFEAYNGDCVSMVAFGGGPWQTNPGGHCSTSTTNIISSPRVTGRSGTTSRVARWIWPISTTEQHYVLERAGLNMPGAGASEYFTFWYRAPNFIYATSGARVGKKLFLIYPAGGNGRITFNESAWSLLESNGNKIDARFDRWPAGTGSAAAYIERLTDGNWHRFTLQRVPETTTGARNGAFRVWFDGELVVERTGLGTYSAGASSIQLAGTFNGGSSQQQEEFFDDLVVWR